MWMVTLTFDLGLQTRLSEEPNMSSMWIWCKSVQWFPIIQILSQLWTSCMTGHNWCS